MLFDSCYHRMESAVKMMNPNYEGLFPAIWLNKIFTKYFAIKHLKMIYEWYKSLTETQNFNKLTTLRQHP